VQNSNESSFTWANSRNSRTKAIQDIITRNVSLEDGATLTEKEKFITEKLLIPVEWVQRAKATLARQQNDLYAEARCLIAAGDWNRAHAVVVDRIAPECVIQGRMAYGSNLT
jgi:hypothetical protein